MTKRQRLMEIEKRLGRAKLEVAVLRAALVGKKPCRHGVDLLRSVNTMLTFHDDPFMSYKLFECIGCGAYLEWPYVGDPYRDKPRQVFKDAAAVRKNDYLRDEVPPA